MHTSYRIVLTCWKYNCSTPFQTYINGLFASYAIANREVVEMVERELKILNNSRKKAYFHQKNYKENSILVYLNDGELVLPVTEYSIYILQSETANIHESTYFTYRSFSILLDASSKKYVVCQNNIKNLVCSSLDDAMDWIDETY